MTSRSERASVFASAAGLLMVDGALAWALPGYVALAFAGTSMMLLGVGWHTIANVARYGISGVEEVAKGKSEAEP